jgi:hypothetical protein
MYLSCHAGCPVINRTIDSKTRCEVFTLEEPVDEAGQVSWREQDQWGHVAGSPLLRIRCI